ncbi:MAG: deoxyribodipyrimidine photo-lyase, partial [Phycisphaerales bacterium]
MNPRHPQVYNPCVAISFDQQRFRSDSLEIDAAMIQPERLKRLNRHPVRAGRYVLYWMQAAQRSDCNHALEYAIDEGNELGKPIVAAFGLTAEFPEANARHYHFMLEGLRQTQADLRGRGVQMVVQSGPPTTCIPTLAQEACCVVVDAGHLRVQRQWRADVGQAIECAMEEVETNLIV